MDIMKAILDIESKAQGIMTSVADLRAQNDEKLKQELESFDEEMDIIAGQKVLDHKKQIESKRIELLKEIEGFEREKKASLTKIYNENHERWAEEIFHAITKGDENRV